VFSKSKIFKFLKRDWGTIPVAEIINGKIEIFYFSYYYYQLLIINALTLMVTLILPLILDNCGLKLMI
jgi:hypothetical protein